MMTESRKIQIIQELSKRTGRISCPICHHEQFTIVDGYFVDTVQDELKNLQLGGRTLPSVMIVCNKCGYIARFALGVLGLMDDHSSEEVPSNSGTPNQVKTEDG